MMMDDLLGHIQEGGGAAGGNDQQQQHQPPPPPQQAAAAAAQDQQDFMAEVDLLLQMEDASQHSVADNFLTGHLSRLQERTSMLLTNDEARWARELKGAVEASQNKKPSATQDDNNDAYGALPPLSDMQVAQYAIVAQGHVLQALQQIHALQAFREEYDIDDSVKQGMDSITALCDQQPHVFLDVDTNPQTQESVIVMDLQAYLPQKAKAINTSGDGKGAEYNWKVLMRGYYYLYRACSSSLASIRHGLFLVVDCHGMAWHNFDLETEQRFHSELLQAYPLKWKKIMAYNTAMVATVCWGLVKRMRGPAFGQALELNCRLVDTDASRPPRRMAELYQQPNAEAVRIKVLRRVQELLQARDFQEEEFQITTATAAATAPPR